MSFKFFNRLPAPPLNDENDENNPEAAGFVADANGFGVLELRLVVVAVDEIEPRVGDILRCGGSFMSSTRFGLELGCGTWNLEFIVGVTFGGVSIDLPWKIGLMVY